MLPQAILATLLRLTLWAGDTSEDPVERAGRLQDASVAISAVSSSREMAAALLALGEAETHFAAYVGTDRCHEGPRGARCDQGRARGYFQLHRQACRGLFELPANDPRATYLGAQCAARLLRWGRNVCGTWSGAFNLYAGLRCSASLGVPRAARMSQVLAILNQQPYPAEP